MSKGLKINYGKIPKILPIPTCDGCDEFVDELWECNTCGHKYCSGHIIQEGNGTDDISFICIECQNERMEGN